MSKKKNLGVVCFNIEYVVDLDDPNMVEAAKECLFEDICNAVKYDEITTNIDVTTRKGLKVSDIPVFLTRTDEEI
jgi:hypothetical protein